MAGNLLWSSMMMMMMMTSMMTEKVQLNVIIKLASLGISYRARARARDNLALYVAMTKGVQIHCGQAQPRLTHAHFEDIPDTCIQSSH